MKGRILIVDDDRQMGELLVTIFAKAGFDASYTPSPTEAEQRAGAEDFDVVVTDMRMRGLNGLELCRRVVDKRPDVPVVVITAFGNLDAAIAAIRAGAWDFITKPFDNGMLLLTIERAVQMRALRAEVKRLRGASQRAEHPGLVGESAAMQAVHDLLTRIADADATVLITGESGTGKEVVARAVHASSARRDGPFVAINCAAMPDALLESELFGHVKGAFTDARENRPGLCLQAQGGTLFLDEVGELPLSLQPKLLRALQERTVRPVGGTVEVPFDARVVAATNRDLETAVEERRFREDLYYRLNVIHVALPPLRARGGDVLTLAQHFIAQVSARSRKPVVGLSPEAAERLMAYAWPGNVRELQNAIERAVAMARFETLTVDDLPEKVRTYRRSHVLVASDDPAELCPMDEVERRYIARVMEATSGNKTLAAQILGFDRTTLYRKLDKFGITPPPPITR